MIAVDDKYKELVKERVREIDSFVEILVNGEYFNAKETVSQNAPYIVIEDYDMLTNLKTVADDSSIYVKYATLEKNYLQLDGTFILPDRYFQQENTGLIGEFNSDVEFEIVNPIDLVEETGNYNAKSTKQNITIYFDKLAPLNDNIIPKIEVELEGLYQRFIPQWNLPTYGNRRTIKKKYTYIYEDNEKIFIDDNKNQIFVSEKIPLNIVEHDVSPYQYDNYEWEFVCISDIKIKVYGNYEIDGELSWGLKTSRIRIKQVNLGETVIYDKSSIIKINVTEQSDIYNLEIPNNTCSIVLDNYDRKFNVVKKNNIINKLTKDSVIKPYYGIGDNGYFNYQLMGCYEYFTFEDNNNLNTTINGKGSIESLESENPYPSSNNNDNNVEWFCRFIFNQKSDNSIYDYRKVNNINYNGIVNQKNTKFNNKREQAQALAIFSNSFVKELRFANPNTMKNLVVLSKLNNEVCDIITLRQQTKQPKLKKIQRTRELNINNDVIGSLNNDFTVLYENKILPDVDMINAGLGIEIYYRKKIFISSDAPVDFYNMSNIKVYVDDVEISSEKYYFENKSYYEAEINISFDNTDVKSIKIMAKTYDYKNVISNYKNYNVIDGSILDYNNNYLDNISDKNRIAKYIFDNEKLYEFEIEMMADPSLEIGDTIKIEIIDGYKLGFIEKIEFNYDGGFIATVKGVCSDVL